MPGNATLPMQHQPGVWRVAVSAVAVIGLVSACCVNGVAPSASAAVATAGASHAAMVPCSQAAQRLTITASVQLDPSCTYSGGFDITESNVDFDCNGALIQGLPGTRALGIVVSTNANVNVDNVTIRRCRIDGFFNNIHLVRQGFRALARGREYDHHLRNVVIEQSTLTHSQGVGIYVNDYVTDTTMRSLVITDAGSTGIYLDHGSRRAHVLGNVLARNGFVENGPGGTNTNFAGIDVRYWGPGREAIAVDGSRDNVIDHNWLINNSYGGVLLYTNCGENVHIDPNSWVDHRYGAEHNTVANNVIIGGETGVWIGSRMGENVYPMDCSDVPYVSGPLQAIILDRAPRNTVRGNTFAHLNFGVRVEDDNATVVGNHFFGEDPSQFAVVVGTPWRTQALNRPVAHATVVGNQSSIAGNLDPYRWVDGIFDLSDHANTALGTTAAFCNAPSVYRPPFVMAYAFALQDPTEPPVPPPAYRVPSLGALPRCAVREA